ncbi:MAG: UbiA prenyltransferase family protein [Halobacteriota archaeon]|jgi:4-hydroxybenzoate polyprenyltransferase
MELITSYLKMMRIRDWIRFYTFFPIVGAFLACGISPNLIPVCAVFFCVIAYGFVINNYFDVEIDQKHKKKLELDTNPLACNRVTNRGTLLLSAVLVAVPALLCAMMRTPGFLLTLLSILVLTLYSAKPARLKDRFLVDIISHGMMFGGFPFLAGFTLAGGTVLSLQYPVAIASLCTIICCEALIVHQIHDYGEDLGNSTTTIVRIGRRMGWMLLALSMLFSLIGLELVIHYFGIGGYPGLGISALVVMYPIYSCRRDVVVQAKSVYNNVLVSHLQIVT